MAGIIRTQVLLWQIDERESSQKVAKLFMIMSAYDSYYIYIIMSSRNIPFKM